MSSRKFIIPVYKMPAGLSKKQAQDYKSIVDSFISTESVHGIAEGFDIEAKEVYKIAKQLLGSKLYKVAILKRSRIGVASINHSDSGNDEIKNYLDTGKARL